MNHGRLLRHTLGMVLVASLLIGCGTLTTTPTPVLPTDTPVPSTFTPVPPKTTPTLTPSTSTGQVRGVLIDTDSKKPLAGRDLLLGIAQDKEGGKVEITLGVGPRAKSDDSGAFLFTDVPPEQYGLAAFLPLPSLLKNDAGAAIAFKVMAGQVTDLGTILVKTK